MSYAGKLKYLLDSALRYWSPAPCPFCQSQNLGTLDRKYLVTVLKECKNCGLLHRHPYEKNIQHKQEYYENTYEQPGITTDLPGEATIARLKQENFQNTVRSITWLLPIFQKIFGTADYKGKRLIDYGCSWGYMTYQFQQLGFTAQGYEISRSRAAFGVQQLGVDIETREDALQEGADLFFSSHVIEHHPSIRDMIAVAKNKLSHSGYFIAVCPNGSEALRLKNPLLFHRLWGEVHPNMITDVFYQHVFPRQPFYIATLPIDLEHFSRWDGQSQLCGAVDGDELFIVCKPHQQV